MKTVEEAIREKILFIGEEVPDYFTTDKRPKFMVLGTPQELIDETTRLSDMSGKWTKAELDKHIQINCKKEAGDYSMVVVLAALYMKLYGKTLPDLGLSGFQGEAAERLAKVFP